MKFEFSQQIFEKYLNLKFKENPSSGSRVVPCGRTDVTEIIFAVRKFASWAVVVYSWYMITTF